MNAKLVAVLMAMASLSQDVDAHGRLLVPPHRGYIGKLPQFKGLVPPNYSDHGLNAGGIRGTSGGNHGVCGDPYTGSRHHETGGTFARFPEHREKVIAGCYSPGSTLDLQVQITANHKGYFEFELCKLNGLNDKESEGCFQSLVQPNGQKQWQLPPGTTTFNMQYALPAAVTCEGDSHCVLRWHYVGWNNPGTSINGQEQFWNCADIYISKSCGSIPTGPPRPTALPTSAVPTSAAPTAAPSCGSCSNCFFASTGACFVGWTKEQCIGASAYTWCGA